MSDAEISRLIDRENTYPDSLALVVTVPLDSSYLMTNGGYVNRRVGTASPSTVYLHPYDNVFIRKEPGWETQRNVVLTGEVQFPGRYSDALEERPLDGPDCKGRRSNPSGLSQRHKVLQG